MGRKPRKPPQNVPDSLPPRDKGTDVLPDDVRRTDEPQRAPPDSLPPVKEGLAPDGGVPQHPVHDSDIEDRDSADYEQEIAAVEQGARERQRG